MIDYNGKNNEEEIGMKGMFLFSSSGCSGLCKGRNCMNVTDGFKDIRIKEI